jgi:hypothetical protein
VAYAAVAPIVLRYFDTKVIQGDEFVVDFSVYEFDPGDGTTSAGGSFDIDREAYAAAGGGAVIVEVEGEEQVVLDELHFDNLDEAHALLQLENPLLPIFLPEGFVFSKFTFPVNPNNYEYMLGSIPAAKLADIYYTNGDDVIVLRILDEGPLAGLSATGEQNLKINGNEAVLVGGSLTNEELKKLEKTMPFEPTMPSIIDAAVQGSTIKALAMKADGIIYSISSESVKTSLYDLVRMAESME